MRITFKPWRPFDAVYEEQIVRVWLDHSGDAIKQKFLAGLTGGHSGRKYASLPNRSSAPGEYPAHQHGALMGGTSKSLTTLAVEVGTTAKHAVYLAQGTSKMAKRKMFREAITEARLPTMGRFAQFRRG